jgi:hypothetical protein
MDISLTDFFRIGRSAVQLYPALSPPQPCLQLQAFRVLQLARGNEIGTDNLGAVPADKDTPFFWSRKWHNSKYNPNALAFEYPLLTMFDVVSETKTSPFSAGFKRCYTVELAVLDVYRDDCVDGKKTGCSARPINQIFMDTELMLDSVLRYFGQIVGATTLEDQVEKLYYRPWLDLQVAHGQIGSYNVTYSLESNLNTNNPVFRFSRVEKPTNKIYGTKCQVTFCASKCPSISYDTSLPDFGLLAFEAGCKNC